MKKTACSSSCRATARRPLSSGRYVSSGIPSSAANDRCEWPVANRMSRIDGTRHTLPSSADEVKRALPASIRLLFCGHEGH